MTADRRQAVRRVWLSLSFSATILAAELAGGLIAHSLALLADGWHMLADIVALGITQWAFWYASRPAQQHRSFGNLRSEILAAFGNGLLLIVVAVWIFVSAWQRFQHPQPVLGGWMFGFALVSTLLNGLSSWILHTDNAENLNQRGAFLHVLGDLAGAVGALIAAVVIRLTGWHLVDPAVSVLIGLFVTFTAVQLLRDSAAVLMEEVPSGLSVAEILETIEKIDDVISVHDLHIWTVTSGFVSLSCHLQITVGADEQTVIDRVSRKLYERYGIKHTTIQVERSHPLGIHADL
ncbi:MAG: cation transporter [Firmicutes bacterium]|nr:cation transporter [Bacillota bacterium]